METTINVPQSVSDELTQILANLVLGDNEIRSKYVLYSSQSCFDTLIGA